MTKHIQRPLGRRLFVQRVTGLAAGAGALMAGLFPEAHAHAAVAKASIASVDSTAVAQPVPPGGEPPSSPLSVLQQNQLYSAALNDASVAQLLASSGVQGRIDPPLEHSQVVAATTSITQTVVLPVVSYATGQRIAVVTYGIDVASPQSPQLRAVILSTGDLKLSLNGQVFDSPKPEWKDVYQLRYFPEQFFARPIRTSMVVPEQRSAQLLARWKRAFSGALVKAGYFAATAAATTTTTGDDGTVLVPDPRLADCYEDCFNIYKTTAASILLTLGIATAMISFWCVLCVAAAIASATVTGPLIVGIIAGKCAYACLFAMGAIAGLLLALQNARTQNLICENNCGLRFPPIPRPTPRPVPRPVA